MTKAQIAAAIQAIVRLQLDDCKRAIKDGTKTIALNELTLQLQTDAPI